MDKIEKSGQKLKKVDKIEKSGQNWKIGQHWKVNKIENWTKLKICGHTNFLASFTKVDYSFPSSYEKSRIK